MKNKHMVEDSLQLPVYSACTSVNTAYLRTLQHSQCLLMSLPPWVSAQLTERECLLDELQGRMAFFFFFFLPFT